MNNRIVNKTLATTAAFAIAALSATSAMAKEPKLYCVDFEAKKAWRVDSKADCLGGKVVNKKDMEIRKYKDKEDKEHKMKKEDKDKKEDKKKED